MKDGEIYGALLVRLHKNKMRFTEEMLEEAMADSNGITVQKVLAGLMRNNLIRASGDDYELRCDLARFRRYLLEKEAGETVSEEIDPEEELSEETVLETVWQMKERKPTGARRPDRHRGPFARRGGFERFCDTDDDEYVADGDSDDDDDNDSDSGGESNGSLLSEFLKSRAGDSNERIARIARSYLRRMPGYDSETGRFRLRLVSTYPDGATPMELEFSEGSEAEAVQGCHLTDCGNTETFLNALLEGGNPTDSQEAAAVLMRQLDEDTAFIYVSGKLHSRLNTVDDEDDMDSEIVYYLRQMELFFFKNAWLIDTAAEERRADEIPFEDKVRDLEARVLGGDLFEGLDGNVYRMVQRLMDSIYTLDRRMLRIESGRMLHRLREGLRENPGEAKTEMVLQMAQRRVAALSAVEFVDEKREAYRRKWDTDGND